MFNLFLPVAIALAALIDAQTGVRIINLDGLFRADDYPASAVDEDHEGTTTIRLTISPNGTVGSCTIVESSGHAALDEQSCAIYRARARFEPARDSKGRTVASQFEQRVVWKLDGEAPVPMPRQAWMTRSTMAASIERRIISCEAEAVGLSSQPFDCKALMELAERDNFLASKGVPIAAYVINEVYFYPLPAAKVTGRPQCAIPSCRSSKSVRSSSVPMAGSPLVKASDTLAGQLPIMMRAPLLNAPGSSPHPVARTLSAPSL